MVHVIKFELLAATYKALLAEYKGSYAKIPIQLLYCCFETPAGSNISPGTILSH